MGAARVYPLEYERFLEPLPVAERGDPVRGHYRLMSAREPAPRRRALNAWTRWENKISDLVVSESMLEEQLTDRQYVLTHSLFEAHYFANDCFLERPLLELVPRLRGLPVTIVQGQLDLVCPPASAVRLSRAVPGSRLHLVAGAGHSPNADVVDQLVRAVDAEAVERAVVA